MNFAFNDIISLDQSVANQGAGFCHSYQTVARFKSSLKKNRLFYFIGNAKAYTDTQVCILVISMLSSLNIYTTQKKLIRTALNKPLICARTHTHTHSLSISLYLPHSLSVYIYYNHNYVCIYINVYIIYTVCLSMNSHKWLQFTVYIL